jgi:hypothetical protein
MKIHAMQIIVWHDPSSFRILMQNVVEKLSYVKINGFLLRIKRIKAATSCRIENCNKTKDFILFYFILYYITGAYMT